MYYRIQSILHPIILLTQILSNKQTKVSDLLIKKIIRLIEQIELQSRLNCPLSAAFRLSNVWRLFLSLIVMSSRYCIMNGGTYHAKVLHEVYDHVTSLHFKIIYLAGAQTV